MTADGPDEGSGGLCQPLGHLLPELGRLVNRQGRVAAGRAMYPQECQQVRMGQERQELIEVAGDALVVDPDSSKDGLVEDATVGLASRQVELVAVFEQIEGLAKGGLLDGDGTTVGSQPGFDLFELASYAGLLGLHQIQWDGIGIVGLEQFAALVKQALALAGQTAGFVLVFGSSVVQVLLDGVKSRVVV